MKVNPPSRQEDFTLRFKDKIATIHDRLYAGKDAPETLYTVHGVRFPDGSDDAIIVFSPKKRPERCLVGTFRGNRIVPPAPEETGRALEYAAALKQRKKLRVDEPVPVKASLVTALSADEYVESCKSTRRRMFARRLRTALRTFPLSFRIGFAVLVIGIASYLALSFSRWTVWTEFYLLNGTYLGERQAAWLFFVWSVPLTLFNAFYVKKYHGFYSILFYAFAPIAIRTLSLLRHYSVVLMLITAGVVLAVVLVTLICKLRDGSKLSQAIESAKFVGAMLLMLVFSVSVFVDLILPNRTEVAILPQAEQTESDPEDEYRFLSDVDLQLLNSPEWDSLSAEKRCDLLLLVAQETTDTLGIDTPSLSLDAQMSGNVAGYYDNKDNSIHLWRSYIEQNSAANAVTVILHELYHAYEYAIVSSDAINWDSADVEKYPYFRSIRTWKEEFESYVPGDRWDVNLDEYYFQSIEYDARAFARYYLDRFILAD